MDIVSQIDLHVSYLSDDLIYFFVIPSRNFMMEIVVKILEGGIDLCLYVRLQLLRKHTLAFFPHRQQIGKEDPFVLSGQAVDVFSVDIMGQFIPPIHFCPRCQAYLFKEERNAAPDLKITHNEVLQTNYLLGFAEICHEALLVHAAVEVSSPALTVASPSYQHVP